MENMQNFIIQLNDKINNYYSDKADKIDNNVKNDQHAIRMLTSLETQHLKETETINDFIRLCKKYLD